MHRRDRSEEKCLNGQGEIVPDHLKLLTVFAVYSSTTSRSYRYSVPAALRASTRLAVR
jgi:hypothetical protein